MLASQRLLVEQSELRERVNAALGKDALTDEERAKLASDTKRLQELETELRAALVVEGAEEQRAADDAPDAEMRERLELRRRASVTNYLTAALGGIQVTGAEAELRAAAGITSGIPIEMFEVEKRADTPTPAPGTVGVNLDRIRPYVFSRSIVPRLGVEMPRVASGTYATATISGSQTATSYAKGVDADSAAATFTLGTSTPKRISARMSVRIEDIAAIGQANFESILRENISLALSSELDEQGLNGTGGNSGADLIGLFERVTDPTAPVAAVDFNAFAASHASMVDGLWANTIKDVMIVCGPETYRLASRTFQTTTGSAGEVSAAAYAAMNTGGFWTNSRMPASASNIQQALGYRSNRDMMGGAGAMRTAVLPHWGFVDIDDIYTGSASGTRFFTMHVLCGDLLLVQPDAYAQLSYQLV